MFSIIRISNCLDLKCCTLVNHTNHTLHVQVGGGGGNNFFQTFTIFSGEHKQLYRITPTVIFCKFFFFFDSFLNRNEYAFLSFKTISSRSFPSSRRRFDLI